MSGIAFVPDPEEPKPNLLDRIFNVWPWVAIVVGVALLLMMAGDAMNINSHLMPQKAKADTISDKYDGDCTGHETAGRCADKCPDGSFLQGYGKDGQALCKLNPTGCPYGDSIPLGPDCEKAGASQQAPTTPVTTTPATSAEDCGGGK